MVILDFPIDDMSPLVNTACPLWLSLLFVFQWIECRLIDTHLVRVRSTRHYLKTTNVG